MREPGPKSDERKPGLESDERKLGLKSDEAVRNAMTLTSLQGVMTTCKLLARGLGYIEVKFLEADKGGEKREGYWEAWAREGE